MLSSESYRASFARFSQLLTGEDTVDDVRSRSFFHRLHTHFGPDLGKLLDEFERIEGEPHPSVGLREILDENRGLARVARATLHAWYTGEFKPQRETPDAPQTPGEYANGLLWKVIKAHAPGFPNAGFGAWAIDPDAPHAPLDEPRPSTGDEILPGPPPMKADYDVIVVGSGVAGSMLACKLKTSNPKLKIAVFEAGDNGIGDASRNRFVDVYALSVERDAIAAYKRLDGMTRVPSPASGVDRTHLIQAGPDDFKSNYGRLMGGTTWAWRGNCPRLVPTDFTLKTSYEVGDDWPITYDQLLPYFAEAENELGVAGESSEWDEAAQGKRGKDYPLPKVPQALGDQLLMEKLAEAGKGKPVTVRGQAIRVIATPQARITRKDGWHGRNQCQGSASCIPICPTGAKYDAGVHVRLASKLGVEFHPRSVVTKVNTNVDGQVGGVIFRTWAEPQKDQTANARYVVLACNAIENARLWLNSRLDNSRDLVGRRLMDHVQSDVVCKTSRPIYPFRGPQNTSSITSFFDHPNRKVVSSFNISVGNDAWGRYTDEKGKTKAPFNILEELSWDAKAERLLSFGDELQRKLRDDRETAITHMLRLSFSTEQLPESENRVTLADEKDAFGVPRPKIAYRLSDYSKRSLTYARGVVRDIIRAADMTPEGSDLPGFQYSGAGHLMGTTRMGLNKSDSVVDADGCSHVHRNLYVVGSSVFVTGSCVNPTVTLAALTLRTADAMAKRM
jgi:glucose dehydrogenase